MSKLMHTGWPNWYIPGQNRCIQGVKIEAYRVSKLMHTGGGVNVWPFIFLPRIFNFVPCMLYFWPTMHCSLPICLFWAKKIGVTKLIHTGSKLMHTGCQNRCIPPGAGLFFMIPGVSTPKLGCCRFYALIYALKMVLFSHKVRITEVSSKNNSRHSC